MHEEREASPAHALQRDHQADEHGPFTRYERSGSPCDAPPEAPSRRIAEQSQRGHDEIAQMRQH